MTALTVGIVAGEVLSFVLPLPFTVWLTGYYTSTLARYYCAVSDAAPQSADGQQMPGNSGLPF